MSSDSIPNPAPKASGEERWLPIPGLEGWYSVSSLGRVRSEPATGDNSKKKGQCHRGRILKLCPHHKGHLSFMVCLPGKKRVQMYVHQAVALAFIGQCPDGREVDHGNSDPTDNRPENLEYVTHLENMRRAAANGRLRPKYGEENPASKLTEGAVRQIRVSYPGKSMRELGRIHGVSHRVISDIVAGRKWRRVV